MLSPPSAFLYRSEAQRATWLELPEQIWVGEERLCLTLLLAAALGGEMRVLARRGERVRAKVF